MYLTLHLNYLKCGMFLNSAHLSDYVVEPPFTAAYLRSLCCWKLKFCPSLKSSAASNRFSSRTGLYLAQFIFPLTLTCFSTVRYSQHPFILLLLYVQENVQC